MDQQVCYPYTLITPWGYVTPEMDTKFNSARALSITAIVLGGAAWFTLMVSIHIMCIDICEVFV